MGISEDHCFLVEVSGETGPVVDVSARPRLIEVSGEVRGIVNVLQRQFLDVRQAEWHTDEVSSVLRHWAREIAFWDDSPPWRAIDGGCSCQDMERW